MIGKTELDRVLFLISWWLTAIKSHNAIGFFDINKVAEGVALKLLNEIYDYQLENLNYEKSNYPGIDLGDKARRIGFQITSRRDARKIRESLAKFADGPTKTYSSGICFLILNQEKKPQLKKENYQEICPNFEPAKHIFNANDLIEEIQQIYSSNQEKFYHIKEVLEVEIAGKAMKRENLKLLRSKLLKGSQKYYDALTGSSGRFKHLDISKIILSHPKNDWINQQVLIEGMAKSPQNVIEALPLLWKKACRHSVILGEGGMGKTVSIVRLWEDYLKKQNEISPVPIFIALNEYNQISDASKRENFILSMIKRGYGRTLTNEEIWELMKTPIQQEESFIPSVILLLDGFNEITLDKRELLIEIRQLIEQARGIQIVITTRYDMRGNFDWNEFNLLKLLELEGEQINLYFQEKGVSIPTSETEGGRYRLRQLIKNPMMLTLYASTCEVQKKHMDDNRYDFKAGVETPGELIWNFLEAQVALLPARLGDDFGKFWFYKFLLKFILPAFGYEMEKNGQFEFSRKSLYVLIEKYCSKISNEYFFLAFPEYETFEDNLNIGELLDDKKIRKRRTEIINILSEELLMLVQEKSSFRFIHQNFRDFFSANHILNQISIELKKEKISEALRESVITLYVRQFIGEIEGEHYRKPFLLKGKGWKIEENEKSILNRALNQCRGIYDGSIDYSLWNILEIWQTFRGELTNLDLSYLDLSKIYINGKICNRFYNDEFFSTTFDGSLLHERNIFPPDHCSHVTGANYSPDSKKIVSAYLNGNIIEWDVETGENLKTYRGHPCYANNVMYSPDGKRILSTDVDGEIKEWDTKSGKCLKNYNKHLAKILNVVYRTDGKRFLSSSIDQTVREWDVESGNCLSIFKVDFAIISCAFYKPNGKKSIFAFRDNLLDKFNPMVLDGVQLYEEYHYFATEADEITIETVYGKGYWDTDSFTIFELEFSEEELKKKLALPTFLDEPFFPFTRFEWTFSVDEISRSFYGHWAWIERVIYNPDYKKILSTSNNGTIKEWDINAKKCLNTYEGHSDCIKSVLYSSDGKKILSSSNDGIIKEWDVESGECLKTYKSKSDCINSVVYSADGKKILSASSDGTIKEWDSVSGECLKTYFGISATINLLIYSQDGKKILTACDDGTIREWDVEMGTCLRTYPVYLGQLNSLRYSPNSKKILVSCDDGTIRELDVETGEFLNVYIGHSGRVNCAVYRPDGKKILSTSEDGTVKEWNPKTGQCLKTYQGSPERISHVEYSWDIKKIIYSSYNSEDQVWEIKKCDTNSAMLLDCGTSDIPIKNCQHYSPDGKNMLRCSKEKIEIIHVGSNRVIMTIKTVPGIFLNKCSFRNLHPDSNLSQKNKALMQKYGAIFD